MSSRENQNRVPVGHGAQNDSRMARLALTLLKRDTTFKAGIKGRRLNAGRGPDYLLRLIG